MLKNIFEGSSNCDMFKDSPCLISKFEKDCFRSDYLLVFTT